MAGLPERLPIDVTQQELSPRSSIEIERKFLLTEFPRKLESITPIKIKQGYLFNEGESGTSLRVRQQGEEFSQTLKSGWGVIRKEVEIPLYQSQFNILWEETVHRIEKSRYEVPTDDGHTIQVDKYQGELEGLITAEVEFTSEEESESFVPPKWLGDEVTEDMRYTNANLAEFGAPENYLELEEGINEVIERVTKRLDKSDDENVVLSIAGGSASGKSYHAETIVEKLQELGIDCVTVSGDNYYIPDSEIDERLPSGLPNWDVPQAIDFDTWRKDLELLKKGVAIDARTNNFDGEGGITTGETIPPQRVIIAEGLHALNNEMREIADIKAFFNVTPHGRMIRRLTRDIHRTPMQGSDIMRYIADVVDPTHEEHVEITKSNADVVINNDYRPEIESTGVTHTQQKFRLEEVKAKLEGIGANLLTTTQQTDRYFQPKGIDFDTTDESIRIRSEGGRNIFGYKGPHRGLTRRKVEILLDDETTLSMERKYGDSIRTIRKDRTFYELNGASIVVDRNVRTQEGDGDVISLGDFIELRSSLDNVEEAHERIDNIRKILGITRDTDPIPTPYAKMTA